mgnify:CR=1 FL=1|tara:strand:- start:834 stop:1991 length:1158 start_codon:yes stop_codon:yes gene_type:complete
MSATFPWFRSRVGDVGVAFLPGEARLLQVRESNGQLRVAGAAWCPLATAESGSRPEVEWARSLRTAVAAGGFAGRRCTICLPREELFMQSMKLPVMPEAELTEAVAWEAATQMNAPRDSIQADWIRTGGVSSGDESNGDRCDLVVVAAHRDAIDARLEAAWAAGLRPEAVETHCWAAARLFSRHHRRAADANNCRAVLEVGSRGGSVLILRGDQIAFCKTLDIGGRHLDEQVADKLGLEVDAARELRMARLRGDAASTFIDPSTDRAVYEAVRPLLAECAHNMLMCLRYAAVTFRGLTPGRIIVTGADGAEPGLAEQVAATCQIAVQGDCQETGLDRLQQDLGAMLPHDEGSLGAWIAPAGMSLRGLAARPAGSRTNATDRSQAA